MFPVRFRQNQTDELVGGFIDYNVSELPPSASDDGDGGCTDERDNEDGVGSDR